ncbi:MAG: carotenoid oxygenase family protein [Acidobacteria bacterium]|nr:carotenoid oxygenase family protein [Acidobacteriota bacterium]
MTRREFAKLLAGASLLSLVDERILAGLDQNRDRLSWRAFQNPSAEGTWKLTKIEGKIPRDLQGTLYRVAPGQKEKYGVKLRHLFDGDAYVAGFQIRDGKVELTTRFVETPQRMAEVKAGKMLYNEFGTQSPLDPTGPPRGGANQPSVNIIAWDGRLLGLSEGGHPSAIDPNDFSFQGYWDFHGTLPKNVPFTAHPKFDPTTGEGYGFGVKTGMKSALMVYHMLKDGTLKLLFEYPLTSYFMVHDMMISDNFIVFVIPPVTVDLKTMFSGKVSLAECLRFLETTPTKLVVMRRDGTGTPVTIEQPSNMVFHHGNAFERDGKLVIDTILSANGDILKRLASLDQGIVTGKSSERLTRLVLDPVKGLVESRTELTELVEFPRFNIHQTGKDARYLYCAQTASNQDESPFTRLVKFDLHRSKEYVAKAKAQQVYGEPVFVPRPAGKAEDDGWVLIQGYDGPKNQNFLEILDAQTLDLAARVWTGQHFPLGFHGNFESGMFRK